MYIVHHLQRACLGCGMSFEDLSANQLNSIHLDHRAGTEKGQKYANPTGYRVDTPETACEEWSKCESTCTKCHDQGERSGGKLRKKKATRGASRSSSSSPPALSIQQHQVVSALESLPRHDGKRVAQFFLRSIAPPPVPMAEVLDSKVIKRAKVFFAAARFQGKRPKKSYQQLQDFVRSCGLEPEQCIRFGEEKWLKGQGRNSYAGQVFMYIVHHLQRACLGCGMSFEDLSANQLNSIHLDHRAGTEKGEKYANPTGYRFDTPETACEEWSKCESTCTKCHDQGERSGGKLRMKKATRKL